MSGKGFTTELHPQMVNFDPCLLCFVYLRQDLKEARLASNSFVAKASLELLDACVSASQCAQTLFVLIAGIRGASFRSP